MSRAVVPATGTAPALHTLMELLCTSRMWKYHAGGAVQSGACMKQAPGEGLSVASERELRVWTLGHLFVVLRGLVEFNSRFWIMFL